MSPQAMERETPAAAGDPEDYTRAVLNILEDFAEERHRLGATERAVLNILEDFGEEKRRSEDTHKATVNILDDFASEKALLESTQKAMLNILDDFDGEKNKVESTNFDLRREVDERTSAERALTAKSTALTASNAELEQFAYVASHDLQEPLRMVSSYMQLLSDRYAGQMDAQATKYIAYALDGATRMQALIAGLLEYSRVGRQGELDTVDATDALHLALRNIRQGAEEAAAVITYDPLPQVLGNRQLLSQVFQNLLANAIKFRRPDEAPSIHVSAREAADGWCFTVDDNGIGIDPRFRERVFVIFQRLHTRDEYGGTGIGLAVCKRVIERFGGRMWIESAAGAGSRFRFTVPRA